jgi:hypothetical protein
MRKILFPSLLLFSFFFSLSSATHAINKIKIRSGQQSEEFYDSVTGEKFYPRGHNYIILGKTKAPWDSNPDTQMITGHIQFDPDIYNPSFNQELLNQYKSYGYNTIRIFISVIHNGNPNGPGLSPIFMDNIADFIKKASELNIYILPVFQGLPWFGGYHDQVQEISESSQMDSYNLYLMNQIFIDRKGNYLKTFIQDLKNRQVPLASILGYEIGNEVLFTLNDRPLKNGGVPYSITTAAGNFNFSNENERQQGINQNLLHWTTQVTRAIKEADPEALVTLSFGDPVHSKDLPYYAGIINPEIVFNQNSPLDFFDIHLYQLLGTLNEQIPRYKIPSNNQKPLIMGEFGVENAHPLSQALNDLKNWQVNSCQNFHFQGWLTWYWPKNPNFSDPNLNFWAADESNNAVNQVLAPIYRSNPCQLQNITPTPTRIPTPTSIPTLIPTAIPTNTPTLPPSSLCAQCVGKPQAKSKGDADCSGTTTLNDFSIWRSEFISSNLGILNKNNWRSDYNCDGKTNLIDASIWRVNFIKSL